MLKEIGHGKVCNKNENVKKSRGEGECEQSYAHFTLFCPYTWQHNDSRKEIIVSSFFSLSILKVAF